MKAIRVFDRETSRFILVTPWFDGAVKPERVGVYQREYPTGLYYSHWDGSKWMVGCYKPYTSHCESDHQAYPWRGLAEDPT